MQTRHWVFTLNNWNRDDEQRLVALASSTTVSYLVFGYETGESGTPHLQGYIIFAKVKRFNEAKGFLPDRTHLEAKRGSPSQASEYCKKDGLFKEFGAMPQQPGSGGQFAQYVDWVKEFYAANLRPPNNREIANAFPALFVRYSNRLRELGEHTCPQPRLEDEANLHQWQKDLEAELVDTADDRSILWYIDPDGGKGKSFFQRYMLTTYPNEVQTLSAGKRDDIAHAVDPTKSIFLFNIPRGAMEYLNYSAIEMIKDRVVFSPKYESTTKILRSVPHVVVFANEHPDETKLTADRFVYGVFSD